MKKNMIPIYLAIFAALLTVAGALYQYKEKKDSDDKADSNQAKADTANAKLLLSQDAMISEQKKTSTSQQLIIQEQRKNAEAQKEIIILNQKLNEKANEIVVANSRLIESQSETIKKIWGDGYAVVRPKPTKKGEYTLYVESKSKYPIYKASLSVIDMNEAVKCIIKEDDKNVFVNAHCWDSLTYRVNDFTLNAGMTRMTKIEFALHELPRYLMIRLSCLHTVTIQYLMIDADKDNDGIIYGYYKIFKVEGDNYTLLEDVDTDNVISEDIWRNKFLHKKEIIIMPY